ncbi:hypothetical protein SAMN04488096_107143 [Mesonia phycicola]|uniref:Lipoprotein n=2 Tax=Mesonia phycicola TaxID=579105 RepID=A0A1M6G553_9FLAO|nr:hypothetical protein SAMN04488096_107143 [Mesonia phycicola]
MLRSITAMFIAVIFYSCQSVFRLYTGVKNKIVIYQTNEERQAYYASFISAVNEANVKVYTLKDKELDSIIGTINTLAKNMPLMYLKNTETQSLYRLSCYEDITYDIENIINDKYSWDYLDKDSISNQYLNQQKYINKNFEVSFDNESKQDSVAKWDVLYVGGSFLGKKLRKRSLPAFKIEGLRNVSIVDLSVNKNTSSE